MPPIARLAARLTRRSFPALTGAPTIQGRLGEMRRLVIRAAGRGDEGLSYDANDWLMKTMKRACRNPRVTAVHSYEDCSLWQFQEAKRLGKACIYDMPIGYYPWWETKQAELAQRYAEWLPAGDLSSSRYVRPQQKREEMELADLVLAPSAFVEQTIREFHPDKRIARAPYGVDLEFWQPASSNRIQLSAFSSHVSGAPSSDPLRFIHAGQCSLRKGIPLLLKAWRAAALEDAELELVGTWQLADARRRELPAGVVHRPACSREELRERYRASDVFVFPSYFEGFGLVLLEAMACGLPVIASEATAGPDIVDAGDGRIFSAGDLGALIELLRWFSTHRDELPTMKLAARAKAETCTWDRYRRAVGDAVAPFV